MVEISSKVILINKDNKNTYRFAHRKHVGCLKSIINPLNKVSDVNSC